MANSRPFYVLGAGTSAGLVPFTADTREYVRAQYSKIGIYPAQSTWPQLPIHERVVRSMKAAGYDLYDLLLDHIPSATLSLLAQKAWSPRLTAQVPPQYAVLRRGSRGVYFNFNVDGLARYYLGCRAVVYEPHGTANRRLTADDGFAERLEQSIDDDEFRPTGSLILPGPEPTSITGLPMYREAATHICSDRDVIVLGYSFGTFRGRMDDSESFEYLVEHIARAKSTVFVVSPDPAPVVAAIEDRLRTNCVFAVRLYWDIFSGVASKLTESSGKLSKLLPRASFDLLVSTYEQALGELGKPVN